MIPFLFKTKKGKDRKKERKILTEVPTVTLAAESDQVTFSWCHMLFSFLNPLQCVCIS